MDKIFSVFVQYFYSMDTNSSFADRLKCLKNLYDDLGQDVFAKKLGISKQNYYSYLRGSQPTLEKLVNILSCVEGLNPIWLIYGKGEMFISGKGAEEISPETSNLDESTVPVSKTEYFEMKKQISELITTNMNLSEFINKKSTAETA